MDQVSRRFLITGKVQGVYFRHSTRAEARRLEIRGVARNLPDGSVEVIAHGSHAAVEQLREWLSKGPPMARVAGVEEIGLPPELQRPAPGQPLPEQPVVPGSGSTDFSVEP